MASSDGHRVQSNQQNLETYSLLWLDAKVNSTDENLRAQRELREVINHLRTFEDLHICEQYISCSSEQDRVVLIVSGQLGRQIVPRIHQLRQLSAIYVYCRDKQLNDEWTRHYAKV